MKFIPEFFGEYWESLITFCKSLLPTKWIYRIKSIFDSEDVGCLLAPIKIALFVGGLIISLGIALYIIHLAIEVFRYLYQLTINC